MKVQKVFIYFSLFFLILVLKVLAEEVYFPDKTIPEKPLINQIGIAMQPVVIVSNPSFLTKPSMFKKKSLPNPPDYLEIVTAYQCTFDKKFYLVKRSNGYWGWMKESEILVSPICLRSQNIKNPSYIRVITIINWRLKKGIIEEIPFRSGPGDQYPIQGKINIFRFRYAFKNNQDRKYIFVGDMHQWRFENPGNCLKGWIKREHCILWENQVGVYFDKKNLKREPILLFQNQKDALRYLQNGNQENAIGSVDSSKYSYLTSDKTRFPVIDSTNNMLKIVLTNYYQLTTEAWVLKKSRAGVNQFKLYALINRFKLNMLLGLLYRIKNSTNISHQNMSNTIKNACEVATGDRILTNETLSSYIQRIFYIPHREVSQVLQYTPEQLSDKMQSNSFMKSFIKNLSKKYEQLLLIQENKTGELEWSPERLKYIIKGIKPHEWWFITSSGEKYCWLPFEYLP